MATKTETAKSHELESMVLRRARVSKMTRALQDRLALANIKIKNGWENRSIDSIEPEIEKELKRKRAESNMDVLSETSSNASANCFSSELPVSSPLTGPYFSDDLPHSRTLSDLRSSKRPKSLNASKQPPLNLYSLPKPHNPGPAKASWKTIYQLPQSSPIAKPRPNMQRPSVGDMHNFSFTSETSTILDSASVSEDDDQDLPLHSFQISPDIPSSPPRTPDPNIARSARLRNKMFSSPIPGNNHAGREGADLLLYLASSPSPAMHRSTIHQPSTPPAKNTPLPSSMMSTPGGQPYLGFGQMTPGAAFNFADYVNVTPSPAQGHWPRTPAAAKTPLAAREARNRLNYDALMPPPPTVVSPNLTRSAVRRDAGLGMDLGAEFAR